MKPFLVIQASPVISDVTSLKQVEPYLFVTEAILTAPKLECSLDNNQLWEVLTYLIKVPVGANCQQIAVFFEKCLTRLYTNILCVNNTQQQQYQQE